MKKKIILGFLIFVVMSFFPVGTIVFAEQVGDSPDSGVSSKIKDLYDDLVSLSYGSESSGIWGDWGEMWNRIRSSAEWIPDGSVSAGDVISGETFYDGSRTEQTGTLALVGDATEADVVAGKTFYSDSFTLLTGTYSVVDAFDYGLQQYNDFDDYEGVDTGQPEDYQGDESEWTNTATNAWQDGRTSLYWSPAYDNGFNYFTNIFPNDDHSSCDFFSSTPRGSYNGLDADCGNAINFCGTLELDSDGDEVAETDWYLPAQKELMQAYIDGIYNQAGIPFTTDAQFWSSTEVSYSTGRAFSLYLYDGDTNIYTKSSAFQVHCVRRD